MKKLSTIIFLTVWFYLCMAVIVEAQTKPASPVLQSGWSTNCVRAIPLHEGSGTTPTDLTGNSTPSMTASTWASDAEGPYFDSNLVGNANIDFDTGLPGASVSNYTVYLRVREVCSGPCGPYYATFTGGGNSDVQVHRSTPTDRRIDFSVQNATNCATCLGTIDVTISPETKYNIIAEYDGDSLRTWLNNVRNCSVKLTNGGNIKNSGYTSRAAHGQNMAVDGCNGNGGMFGNLKLYTIVIWTRLLTPTERAQIQANPYVMYEAAGGRRNVIIIQSMLPNIDSLLYLIIYLSLIGIAAGIYKFIWQEKRMKRAGNR